MDNLCKVNELVNLNNKKEMYRFWVSDVEPDACSCDGRISISSDPSDISPYSNTSKASNLLSSLRIMTFNSLAHSLVDLKYEKNDKEVMDWSARKIAILNVIRCSKAHIVCLQEIDANDYSDFFNDKFREMGYETIYKQKNDRKDGVAILYNSDIFDVLFIDLVDYPLPSKSQVAIVLSLVVKKDVDTEFLESIAPLELNGNNDNNVNKSPSISGFDSLIVCNTHLLFNTKRGDIKFFQLIDLLTHIKQMEDKCREYFEDLGREHVPSTFICGDFNFTPQSSLYKFLDKGFIDLSNVRLDHLSGQHLMFEHSYGVNSHGHHQSGATIHEDEPIKEDDPRHFELDSKGQLMKYSSSSNNESLIKSKSFYLNLQQYPYIGLFKQPRDKSKFESTKSLEACTPDTVCSEDKCSPDLVDLNNLKIFETEEPNVLYCPIKLRSAYNFFDPYLRTYQEPAFTAFHGWQRGCVDYIWYTPNYVQVKAIYNMPSYGEVTSHGNMPNRGWPASDHFSLISEFTRKFN